MLRCMQKRSLSIFEKLQHSSRYKPHHCCYLQIRLMRLSEFQDKHAGDLTGPALEEIKHRQQALRTQLMAPPATGQYH